MKKLIFSAMLMLAVSAQAQDTGDAAAAASNAGAGNSWDQWVFTGGAFVAVAGGLISLCVTGANGSSPGEPFTIPTPTSH
jgi:hypothetical protein